MKAKITGVDYLTLLPENDADKAILTRWDTMRPMWGGGSLGSQGLESLQIRFYPKDKGDHS